MRFALAGVLLVLLAVVTATGQPVHCTARGDLPDPQCTPGSINRSVSQANIGTTICKAGWTATIRPSASYTGKLKRRQMQQYGFTGGLSQYEEDHLIPLELGGSPTNSKNLWPEYGATPNPKDGVENALRARVCAGRISLAEAQQRIATNWHTALQ